jgi:hypothetical protein
MKKLILFLPLIAISMVACGPSKAEIKAKAQLQAMQDSIANAAEQQKQDQLKQQLIELKSQLAAEETKMQDIQEWKLGRAESEKEQQVADQTRVMEQLKSQISDTQNQIK